MLEYYGKCLACGSYNIETVDNYDKPTNKGSELHYICVCSDCGSKFDVTDED